MATLSKPQLTIKLISGTSNAEVMASINLGLNDVDKNLIKLLGIKFRVSCSLWGSDSGLNGDDDLLFTFARQTKVGPGTVVFKTTLNRDVLDEDWGNDEIYARFSLSTNSPTFPANVSPKDSPIVTGNF